MKCTYYQIQKRKKHPKHECLKKEERVSKKCYYKYCSDDSYKTCPIYNEETQKNCIFNVILNEKMQVPEGTIILENIYNFRKNILEQDDGYQELITIHDRISPIVSETIRTSNNEHLYELLNVIYLSFLLPLNRAISKKETEDAIKYYNKMLKLLIVSLSLDKEYYQITYYYRYPENYYKRPKKRIIKR